ncbi:MAG: hypothetical protein KC422_02825 [Trueperaceae bacterium]|nr:hypothetical protein [Trueperaceae bacterium]
MSNVTERIERDLGIDGLVSRLVSLSPTDLQSLLLEVYQGQSQKKSAPDVLTDYLQNRFVRPAAIQSKILLELNTLFLEQLPQSFEVLELSPVCPLGTTSVVAELDQDWSVSTSRNTEVVSDATNVLALEAAVRRKTQLKANAKSLELIHLAANHRFLRPQFYNNPKFLPHFQMISLVSAGRDRGNLSFEIEALLEHLRFYLAALRAFLGEAYRLEVQLTDFHAYDRSQWLEAQLLQVLADEFPEVSCRFKPERESGRNYYRDLCFHLYLTDTLGNAYQIADGGSVDWTANLLSNAKERLLISGLSSERLCLEKVFPG